jgi:hypothetical protein
MRVGMNFPRKQNLSAIKFESMSVKKGFVCCWDRMESLHTKQKAVAGEGENYSQFWLMRMK